MRLIMLQQIQQQLCNPASLQQRLKQLQGEDLYNLEQQQALSRTTTMIKVGCVQC